ncbi:hypothetical protein WICPIJ_003805 [Wickerhamomyces pijperi]|uniref:Uncharacterized protein n=1 Tax=Wickerhamomyces pijperi TaxID=599730 RepID=A0A9P8Q751_WICPI|nr:hypothetical protein WICPIJ_003805 [Wickerhamomyces pijperi]
MCWVSSTSGILELIMFRVGEGNLAEGGSVMYSLSKAGNSGTLKLAGVLMTRLLTWSLPMMVLTLMGKSHTLESLLLGPSTFKWVVV